MSRAKKKIVFDIHAEMLLYFDSYMHAVNDGIEVADAKMIGTILQTIKNEDVEAEEEMSSSEDALDRRLQAMKSKWGSSDE